MRVCDGAEVLEVGALAESWVYDGGMFFGGVEGHTVVVTPVVYGCLELLCVVVELVVGRVLGVGAFVKVVLGDCSCYVGKEDGPAWWSKDGTLVNLVRQWLWRGVFGLYYDGRSAW